MSISGRCRADWDGLEGQITIELEDEESSIELKCSKAGAIKLAVALCHAIQEADRLEQTHKN